MTIDSCYLVKRPKSNIIYKGECENYLSKTSLFPDNSIDLIITSPPYADRREKSYGGIKPEKYVEWFLPISVQLYRILKPKGSFILNIKENVKNGERQTYVLELILALKRHRWLWVEEYCWYKKNSYPGKWPNRFRDTWERCLHFTKQKKFKMYQDGVKVPMGDWKKPRFKSLSEKDFIRSISGTDSHFGRKVSNWLNRRKVYPHNVVVFEKEHFIEPETVIHFATECSNRNHSAVFPIELPSWFIKLLTKKGDVVLDPFIGAGTTAIAAILLERSYVGIELVPEYAKVAEKNIRELQGIRKRLKSKSKEPGNIINRGR